MSGLDRIAAAFAAARAEGRAALMPYFTLGYPDPDTCLEVVQAIARAGADLIELGVPFSDPLADGPTIQRASQIALGRGTTPADCLAMVSTLRARGVVQPLLLMGYLNPFLQFGLHRLVAEAAAAGADGFIVPDLPLEEATSLEAVCRERGLVLVYLLAPTSTEARIRQAAARASGFLYLVSLTGVTGARDRLPPDLAAFVARVRAHSRVPLAVGFGLATPEQARAVGRLADGVIVGSALIRAVRSARGAQEAAAAFVGALRAGLDGCKQDRGPSETLKL